MEDRMSQIIAPNLGSAEFKANPYPFYARLRAEAPVYHARLSNRQSAWLVTRYDDVLAVLKDERLVKDRANTAAPGQPVKQPWMPGLLKPLARNMLDLDGADHARLRGLVHKVFTPRLIEQMRGQIQARCDNLLDRAQPKGGVELVREYALALPLGVITDLLGIPAADRAQFARWSQTIVATSSTAQLLRALPAIWRLTRYLRALFERRRADPRDDLVTGLVQAEEAGDRLSQDELLAMVVILLIAGHETTVNLIASGTLALLEHPGELARLRQSPELIKPAVEELVRFCSPVELATERYAREELTIAGVSIPRGDMVLAVLGSANHDERQFADPERLDIAREPNRHLAFGQGVHYCVGSPLARMEGQIAISTLLARMPNLRLQQPADRLRWRRQLFLRGLERLPLAC
jgi:cytochrome P450 PksS